jgi:6-phosphofructokinase 1
LRKGAKLVPKNILYAQSGGVTAVINASACGVIEAARAAKGRIGKVYAGRDGIIGALTENLIDTSRESAASVRALMNTPGGAFGSARYKLPPIDKDRRPFERLIEVFRAHDIGWFLYNGGNDSMDTCAKIARIGAELGYPVAAIGIPKTMDNDLVETDTCPGFGSVAKYVATSMREASFDVASMARTSTRVFVMEVMGRHAGWVTAACGLAAEERDDGPQILLFPELPFDEAQFLAKVKATVERVGWCTIGVSEGVRRPDGKFLAESGLTDAFGHAQLGGVAPMIADLVKRELKYKNHWAVCDYLQRAARHIASATDLEQSYRMGVAAVKTALAGQAGVMMTIERVSAKPYRWRVGTVPLARVANRERKVPRGYISRDGFSVTPACREYLTPLVRGEAPPPFRDGLPRFVKLANHPVQKKLPKRFEI